jgi:hypothetical protein
MNEKQQQQKQQQQQQQRQQRQQQHQQQQQQNGECLRVQLVRELVIKTEASCVGELEREGLKDIEGE